MVGMDVVHCVCAILVLFAHLDSGRGDVVNGGVWSEQTRQASRDVVMREDVEEVFYITGLQESRGRNNGHLVAPNTETHQTLTEMGTRHRDDNIIQSPPPLHPGNQHVAQNHRNKNRDSPHGTSELPSFCLHKPDQRDCGAVSKRYYFDQTTMECYNFIHAGCRGTGNNFETLKNCNLACLGHE